MIKDLYNIRSAPAEKENSDIKILFFKIIIFFTGKNVCLKDTRDICFFKFMGLSNSAETAYVSAPGPA